MPKPARAEQRGDSSRGVRARPTHSWPAQRACAAISTRSCSRRWPKRRPSATSTVAEFADDLRRHRDGEPVHARPASWRYRARKFVMRNR